MKTVSIIVQNSNQNLNKLSEIPLHSDSPHLIWDIVTWAHNSIDSNDLCPYEIRSYFTERDYDQVAYWLDSNKIRYSRVIRTEHNIPEKTNEIPF